MKCLDVATPLRASAVLDSSELSINVERSFTMHGSINKTLMLVCCCALVLLFAVVYYLFNATEDAGPNVECGCGKEGSYRQRLDTTEIRLVYIAAAIRVYYAIYDGIPSTERPLMLQLEEGKVEPFDSVVKSMADGWDSEIEYSITNSLPMLRSPGADRLFETADDIRFDVALCKGTNRIWSLFEDAAWNETKKRFGLKTVKRKKLDVELKLKY